MILGFAGPAGAGKDTAAAHLVAHHGYERRAFADPMRAALYALARRRSGAVGARSRGRPGRRGGR